MYSILPFWWAMLSGVEHKQMLQNSYLLKIKSTIQSQSDGRLNVPITFVVNLNGVRRNGLNALEIQPKRSTKISISNWIDPMNN